MLSKVKERIIDNFRQATAIRQNYNRKELYLVTDYLTDENTGETSEIWVLYGDIDSALRWIYLCMGFGLGGTPGINMKIFDDFKSSIIKHKKGTYEFKTFKEMTLSGTIVSNRFVLKVIK